VSPSGSLAVALSVVASPTPTWLGLAPISDTVGEVLNRTTTSALPVEPTRRGKLAEAVTHFAIAVQLRPDLADAHRNLGLALANLGRFDEALREFREVLRLKPDDANVRRAVEELQKRGRSGGPGGR
jgi:tetratricopeptide (TPR) repeat protein